MKRFRKRKSIINEQQAAFIEEEKEEITAEKIIEQELLKANLQPVAPIVPPAKKETIKPVQSEQVSQPVSKKTAPVKEKSPVPYLIAVIVIVLLLCGGVILFIYYPDLFSSSSDKNALDMPPVTTQPVQPEAQLSDTIEQKDTTKVITPDVSKVATPHNRLPKRRNYSCQSRTSNSYTSNLLLLPIWIQHLIKLREPRQNIQSKKEKL